MPPKTRCWWCGEDPLYIAYHDDEWGVPLHDDRKLFEMLLLEGFQAGLSWITILRKRENFRKAFRGFDPEAISRFTKRDFERLMNDSGIVWGFRRNRTLFPKGSRTAFRDDPEHHRSVATLASRLCGKVFGFVKRNYPERSGGRIALAEKGARGKGRQPLSPPQHTEARSASSAPLVETQRSRRIDKFLSCQCAIASRALAPIVLPMLVSSSTKASIAAASTGMRRATDSTSPNPLHPSPRSFTSTTAWPTESRQ